MRRDSFLFAAFVAFALIVGACSSAETTATSGTDTTTTAPATSTTGEPVTTTGTPTTAPAEAPDEIGFDVSEGSVTLLRYLGDVRASRDGGQTWFYGDSGLRLEQGDRVQVSGGGIAVIMLPDGTRFRLEGFTDFELVRAEFDHATGSKYVVARLWEGSVLVSTLPLPTPDSLMQLWSMSTFIDLPYSNDDAISMDEIDALAEEDRIVFGAVMTEEAGGEVLINYPDSVLPTFYTLQLIDGEVVAIAGTPFPDDITEYQVPYRDDIADELVLERMLDVVAALVSQQRSGESGIALDFIGYSMLEQGPLSDRETLIAVFETIDRLEFVTEGPEDRAGFVRHVQNSPPYAKQRWIPYRYTKRIPDIFAPEILMQISQYNLGCDITTGLGCAIPDGCDTESGQGCTFVSGCNIITRDGCATARLACIAYANCYLSDCNKREVITHFCKPRIRSYCDPRVPGDCDQYLAATAAEEGTDTTAAGTDEAPDWFEEFIEPERISEPALVGNTLFSFHIASSIPVSLMADATRVGDPVMDPNEPASCTQFVNDKFWTQQESMLDGGFDDEGDEDEEWCTCRAAVPPGYPPPPPWKDMEYRCFCSDPGAYHGSKG